MVFRVPHELHPLRLSQPYMYLLLLTAINLLNHHSEQERSRRRRGPKKLWVHPIVQERANKGHFNVLYQDLRRYPEKFQQFCQLAIAVFDRLLCLLSPDLVTP